MRSSSTGLFVRSSTSWPIFQRVDKPTELLMPAWGDSDNTYVVAGRMGAGLIYPFVWITDDGAGWAAGDCVEDLARLEVVI